MMTQTVQPKQSVLFVDSSVQDYKVLVDGVKAGTKVVMLDADQDGVLQIADALNQYTNVASIHILSHGNPGQIYLGNATLNQSTLSTYQSALQTWGHALSNTADIFFYGCNVAKGIGREFIRQLSTITQANIAASIDITGAAALGGNWELAFKCGQVNNQNIFEQSALESYNNALATETITFVQDELSGEPLASYTKGTTSYGNLTIKGTDSGIATTFPSLVNLTNPAGLYDALSQAFGGGTTGIGLGDGSNGASVGTWFVFATANGGEFDLVSLTIGEGNGVFTSMEAVGFRDGSQVGSQPFTLTAGGINQTITLSSSFDNVDEIRVRQKTPSFFDAGSPGQDGVLFENFVFQPAPTPTLTSATYDASTNSLVVTGTNLSATAGALNDIDTTKLTLTGEGGATYTLTSPSVEIDSATQFTVILNTTDQINVEGLLNKNGTSAVDATTFNIAAAADWNPANTGNADATGNGITVSNVQTPTITSATYDASTGSLVITGTNFVKANGASNDITANKLTFTGEGGATYTLTNSANVEITSATAFTITLSATDKAAINQIINKNGTSSTSSTTYNIAVADDWNTTITNADISDATNPVTVSNVAAPTLTSSTYDASSGALVVTGSGFLGRQGATNDIVANKFTFTGEGGATYTLTDSANVEITSGTAFTLTLSATDKAAVNQIINKNGTLSTDISTYNLAAAEDWAAGADAAVTVADVTGNNITASNVAVPTITSSTYDASSGALVVTGSGFLGRQGATNDIVANKFTFTGEGGATYTLTDSANVEITSGTAFTLTLSATDKAAVNQIINKNGTLSTDISTYNLAAAEDWAAGADAAVTVADVTGNNITASNVAVPTITSSTYDASSGALVVTGSGFLGRQGATNDIVANKFTFTGEGGATYTLTDSANVEITSGTAFTLTLSATDKAAVNQIINKNGTLSTDISTYNLAAAEDWAAGADAAVAVADLTGNNITASNVAVPVISSATYDASSGALVVTGSGFLGRQGATNDIVANKFTFTGEGGATYTLTDSANVEITSGTAFTLTLSATDKAAVNQIINKNGTLSTDISTYNLAAAEDWAAGADAAVAVADLTGNNITASNVAVPVISSATYDASSGALVVTGSGFLGRQGATNDIVANKFTFTGEGGATYTLTDSANVEITSGTAFTLTLSATDKAAVNQIINKNGTLSTDISTYNLAAAEDWAAGADAAVTVADLTGNNITASNVAVPVISSATYDYNSNILTVTGTGFLKKNGAANDVDLTKLTITGEGGATYTLTNATGVEITSGTSFTTTLTGADLINVEALLNKDGTTAVSAATYNLAGAEDWAVGADTALNVADLTGNGITVNNYAAPTVTSATYDANNGQFVIIGTNFINKSGATNDLDASLLTITGEGGATYTLTDSSDVEITSAVSATVILSSTDQLNIQGLLNKAGAASGDATTYNLAAADNWLTGAPAATDIADLTGNGITVSNVQTPTITSATYDASTGSLVVTGTNFVKANGAFNDITANKLTFTGEGGVTYTLTDSANVEITSGTAFTLTLSATDKAAVNQIINKNGAASTDATTYNLAAAEDWAAGADTALNVADLTGNGITVSNYVTPSSGGGGGATPTPTPTPTPTLLIDGVATSKTTQSDGTVITSIPVVESTRQDDPASLFSNYADIPLVTNSQGRATLTVSVPVGVGLTVDGQPQAQNKQTALADLIKRVESKTLVDNEERQEMTRSSQTFLDSLALNERVSVQTITPAVNDNQSLTAPIVITGSNRAGDDRQALVIDANHLPSGATLQLDDIAFAAIIGSARVVGGSGQNFVIGDNLDQFIVLGADDDRLSGGGGDDTVGSLGGDDQTFGDAGNDTVYGGTANDTLSGGAGDDRLNGGLGFDIALQEGQRSDYQIEINGNSVALIQADGSVDTLTDIELIQFADGTSLAISHTATEAAAHHLVTTWLGRNLNAVEGSAVQNWKGANVVNIVEAFLDLPEAAHLRNKTASELLAGLDDNPAILQLNTSREINGGKNNDQGYLPLGLALNVDGESGHDVLRMLGSRNEVHLETAGNALEITRLEDGAMLSLSNAEAIAFDSGETVILAHDAIEGSLARLVHTFLDRSATAEEWQAGREALAAHAEADMFFNWFHNQINFDHLNNSAYIQVLYQNTLQRKATPGEITGYATKLANGSLDRDGVAVDIAQSDEAIIAIGSVIELSGGI